MPTLTRPKRTYELTPAQRGAAAVLAKYRVALLFGGSRSGKTFLALRAVCKRAIENPATNHLVARFRFNHAKQSICYQTMPEVIASIGMTGRITLNKTDWFYELPNASTIWIGGLDDKERTEKILGNEYATIFENEASQITYDSHETLTTRLNPPKGLRALNVIDYNPPSIHHWGYSIFHKGVFPDGRPVPQGVYGSYHMNPSDNPHLSDEYLESLGLLSEAKRRRFLAGEYSEDAGTLLRRAWIRYCEPSGDYDRVVVGVDPSGSKGGDEVGIVVAGRANGEYLVLDDYSVHGTPSEWAAEVARAYTEHKADAIVAEANYGGEMVLYTIRTAEPKARVIMVHATRGKVVRAEPISALYEQGKVRHARVLQELEDEMCMYDPEVSASPNRMDALVWALSELSTSGSGAMSVPDLSSYDALPI